MLLVNLAERTWCPSLRVGEVCRTLFAMSCRVIFSLALLSTSLAMTGCNAGRISDENSRLRRENLEQTEKIKAQESQIVRLQAQGEALSALLNQPKPAVDGVKRSDIPVATRITFGRYSGALDDDNDGNDDTIRVYVLTEDQKGRFIPIAGKAVLQVVVIDADAGVQEIARKTFDPQALDAAFTSGLTGTHYTLETAIPNQAIGATGEVTVKVTLVDASTGASLTAQIAIELDHLPKR